MKSSKHILMLTPGFPADENDDSCIPALHIFLSSFAKRFSDYKISVVSFHYPFSNENYVWNSIDIYPCNGKNKSGVSRILLLQKVKNLCAKIHSENQVDLIHSLWLGECAEIGKKFSAKWKVPMVNTLMGQDVRSSNRFLFKQNLKNIFQIALSTRHAEEFEKNACRKPNAIIPWGIESIEVKISSEKDFDLLGVGSLIPLKRFDLLIRAVAVLKEKYPKISVGIIGEGEERNKLEQLIQKLDVQQHVKLLGKHSRQEVLSTMGRSKILIHPSEFESFGFVFILARKMGMEIVSFPVGIAEQNENWKMVDSLEEMISVSDRQLEIWKQSTCESKYPVSSTVEQYEEIYRELFY